MNEIKFINKSLNKWINNYMDKNINQWINDKDLNKQINILTYRIRKCIKKYSNKLIDKSIIE